MADTPDAFAPVEGDRMRVWVDRSVQTASLRHFDRTGEFSSAICRLLGVPLAETSCATYTSLRKV